MITAERANVKEIVATRLNNNMPFFMFSILNKKKRFENFRDSTKDWLITNNNIF